MCKETVTTFSKRIIQLKSVDQNFEPVGKWLSGELHVTELDGLSSK